MTAEEPTLDLERLEAIAQGATPGPRDCDGFSDFSDGVDYTRLALYSGNNQGPIIAEGITSQADAKFLVTFDREIVLALIAQQQNPPKGVEPLELDLDELQTVAENATSGPRVYDGTFGNGHFELTLHSRKIMGPVIADKIAVMGDASFFAVFDQSTVLELIAGVRAAREEALSTQELNDRLAAILRGTANALIGPPPELTEHSWHDLPELAAAAVRRAEMAEAVAGRWEASHAASCSRCNANKPCDTRHSVLEGGS